VTAVLLSVVALWAPAPATVSWEAHRVWYGIRTHHHATRKACRRHWDRRCRRHVIRIPAPVAPPADDPSPAPPPLPSRTGVDLAEWRVTPAYRELAAGPIEFNAANLGEDDHDFTVRDADAVKLESVALAAGQTASVRLTLAAGVYTLYCSLPEHEGRGMRAKVTVR
jgi:uncharacterized cupredoxin-like copper-binding protein